MLDLFDNIDLHVVLMTLICVPIVIMVPGNLAIVFLVGSMLAPQPLLWIRAVEREHQGRAMRPYILANEIAVVVIVCFAAYVWHQG